MCFIALVTQKLVLNDMMIFICLYCEITTEQVTFLSAFVSTDFRDVGEKKPKQAKSFQNCLYFYCDMAIN